MQKFLASLQFQWDRELYDAERDQVGFSFVFVLCLFYLYCVFLYLYLYFSARARISIPNKYFLSQRSATHLISMRSWALSLTFSGFYQLFFLSITFSFFYKLNLTFLCLTWLHVTLFELSDKTGTLTRNEMVLKMWVRDGHVCSVEEVVHQLVYCGFSSNWILLYFPLFVCSCVRVFVCHRRDISHFSHI